LHLSLFKPRSHSSDQFLATVSKTVRPVLVRLSCLSLCAGCDVGVLWPNGSMDQDQTWHAGRPRYWPHCVRWGHSSPFHKGVQPQYSAHICCAQMASSIKTPLGMEVGLGPGHTVLDGDPAPPKNGHSPSLFGPYYR